MSYTSGYYSGYNKKICQKIYSYGIMPIVDKKERKQILVFYESKKSVVQILLMSK